MTKSRDLSNLGGGIVLPSPGSVSRPVAKKLEETPSIKDFGAIGDGIADDTTAFAAFLAAGGGFIPAGTYSVSEITISDQFDVVCEEGATIKRRNQSYGASSVLLNIVAGAEFSTWRGGIIDGNRSQLKAEFDILNPAPTAGGSAASWREFIVDCSDITIESLRIQNTCAYPFIGRGDNLYIDGLYCYDHGTAIQFGYNATSPSGLVPRPPGAGGVGQTIRNVTSDFQNNAGSNLSPHPIDIDYALESYYSNIICINMSCDASGSSSYQSGITIENCINCTFDRLIVDRFLVPSSILLHVAVSCLGVKDSKINPIVKGCDGQMLELNACRNIIVENPQLDGEMNPGSSGGTYYRGDWNQYRNSKSIIGNINCRVEGGYVIRHGSPIIVRDNGTSFHGTKIIGAINEGIRFKEEVFNDFFPGNTTAIPNSPIVLENVEIAYCGGAGLISDVQRRASIFNCWIHDNGQNGSSVSDGVRAANMDNLDVIGCIVEDTQGGTKTKAATYEPQTGTMLKVYLNDFSGIGVGQRITLVNGSTSGNVVGKIIQINTDDSIDFEVPSSTTLKSAGNLTQLTGFWATSIGNNLAGFQSAALTDLTEPVWITDGVEWRRVVRVFNDKTIRIDAPFSRSFTGTRISKLNVDVLTVKSQQNGIRVFSSVSNFFLKSNSVRNNGTANYLLSAPQNLQAGSEYERNGTVSVTSGSAALLSNIPKNHQIEGLSVRVDSSLAPSSSWDLERASSSNVTIDSLGSGLSIAANTKLSGAIPAISLIDYNNYRVLAKMNGAPPTNGAITFAAQLKVASEKDLPSLP